MFEDESFARRRLVSVALATPLAFFLSSRVVAQVATPGASPVSALSNKQLVSEATDAFFNQHDISAVDHYVGETYTQHSTLVGDGRNAFRELVASLGDGVNYESVRLLADGDFVAAQGQYHGFGEVPLVAFDIFRVADGKLAEHWDGLTPNVGTTPSGHTQLDGPTEITRPDQTEASRDLVEAFADAVLIGGAYDRLPEFVSTDSYVQHNPQIADGLEGLGAAVEALAEQGLSLVYHARHRTVAEGEFVLLQSDGDFGGPVVYYDLFRVDGGRIVEHWDVIQPIPAEIPHDNGLF